MKLKWKQANTASGEIFIRLSQRVWHFSRRVFNNEVGRQCMLNLLRCPSVILNIPMEAYSVCCSLALRWAEPVAVWPFFVERYLCLGVTLFGYFGMFKSTNLGFHWAKSKLLFSGHVPQLGVSWRSCSVTSAGVSLGAVFMPEAHLTVANLLVSSIHSCTGSGFQNPCTIA